MAGMDDLKDRIRKFLGDMEMSRDVFALLCGVKKSQVDKWLSTVPIAKARRNIIERVMRDEYSQRRRSDQNPNIDVLEIPFPRNQYDHIIKTAARHGMTVPEYLSEAVVAISRIPCK